MYHEKLAIWKLSCELSVATYHQSKSINDFGFKNQITRSALSVPSNIAEGMERDSQQEKYRFLSIAKASLGEYKTQLIIGQRVGFLEDSFAKSSIIKADKLSKMIGKLMKSVKEKSQT
ncbi:four helix bundle protein [Thalassotalea litorea]|uniref:Four helix bundle protein n=1 Tax=Thalassotalea litorea TaxID=2020715 RepID=A0A5R9IHR0_9GAMM|nr:four helix bundle protein [Thalassotalea litorea]TLU65055.1 four helix bundle protein [Thalassotalea litorea]